MNIRYTVAASYENPIFHFSGQEKREAKMFISAVIFGEKHDDIMIRNDHIIQATKQSFGLKVLHVCMYACWIAFSRDLARQRDIFDLKKW